MHPKKKWEDTYHRFLNYGEHLAEKARYITLPGLNNVPLHDVGVFFWKGIRDGAITTRASSIAFNFFLAIFPGIIALFTMIPYIPVEDFQEELLTLIQNVTPTDVFKAIEETVEDIILQPRGDLLSFGFIAVLFFSTNGIAAIITAFNETAHSIETRSWIWMRIISVVLFVIEGFLLAIAILLITLSETGLEKLLSAGFIQRDWIYYLILFGRWIIIILLFLLTYSFIYYFAPAKRTHFRFISTGSLIATVFSIITSGIFSYYINQFGRYNKLYGSIGTLIAVLMLIYLNSFIMIIGFELNIAINQAKLKDGVRILELDENEYDEDDY